MSSGVPQPAPYINLKLDESGKTVVDVTNSPEHPNKIARPYVNITPQELNRSPSKESPKRVRSPKMGEEKGMQEDSPAANRSPLRRHLSETGFWTSKKSNGDNQSDETLVNPSSMSVEQAITNAKFELLSQQGAVSGRGCEKCDELMELLSSWQIGAGSLMRNYSRILSLLMKTRDSALALECRLMEQSSSSSAGGHSSSSSSSSSLAPGHSSSSPTRASGGGTKRLVTRDDSSATSSSAKALALRNVTTARVNGVPSREQSKSTKNRQSMFVTSSAQALASANIHDQNMADNMYPNREDLFQPYASPTLVLQAVDPATYGPSLEELKTNLWGAIDLCQQLAAACFKKTHLMNSTGKQENHDLKKSSAHSQSSMEISAAESLFLSSSVPTSGFVKRKSEGAINHSPQFKSSLNTIREVAKSKNRKKRRDRGIGLVRAPSAPSLECSSEGMTSSGEKDSVCSVEDGFVHVTADGIPDSVTKAIEKPTEGLKEVSAQSGRKKSRGEEMDEQCNGENQDPGAAGPLENVPFAGSSEGAETESLSEHGISPVPGKKVAEEDEEEFNGGRSESMLADVSTYTDSDVKYVMSKIASLEEERYKLLETIDKLHNENSTVRLSLHEIFGDLENKDLQLTLAMQDLSIATEEIRKATDMRKKLKSLSGERDSLLERLEALEDESSAVKVSLVQLLQEKSATNKTLALENWRLTRKAEQSSKSRKVSGELATPSSPPPTGGDNISIHSGYSATADDNVIQEAVMGADMIENFVHKQGFLVKQGGRVKSWRKRLFVLNTNGLSYYKTEQPIQTVPIGNITKVQVCHGRCSQPHMFEVHTQNRIFYLSASSADEMQSWVGMLETLKQYRRTATMHAKLMKKATKGNPLIQQDRLSRSTPQPSSSSSPPPLAVALDGEGSEDDEPSTAAAAGRIVHLAKNLENSDSEDDDGHVTLHQQISPVIIVRGSGMEDSSSYLAEIASGVNLSVPEGSPMRQTRSSMSGAVIEGLDLSNL